MKPLIAVLAIVLLAAGCGGSKSASPTAPATQPQISASTAGEAQGVYSGTTSAGSTFVGLFEPNDDFAALYGTQIGNVFYINGILFGRGQSDHGTYTSSWVDDYYYSGGLKNGSLTAKYVPGSTFNGTLTETGTATITLAGTVMPSSTFNYNTPFILSDVVGNWSGTLLDGTPASITVSTDGAFAGSSVSGCSFSGKINSAGDKNFFGVQFTFAGSPCPEPNTQAVGVGVDYLVAGTTTRQVVMGARTTTYYGGPAQVFVGTRQ